MEKSTATVKVDTEENWAKAINFVPDIFTIVVYTKDGCPPKIKMGDGKTKLKELPFLNSKEVIDDTLIL